MAKAQTRYVQVIEGKWYDATRKDREQCCDCSLVHRLEYRLRRTLGGFFKIEMRCYRDDRATRAIRKRAGIKIVRPKKLPANLRE